MLVSVPEGRLGRKIRQRSSRLADPGRINYRGWSGSVSEFTPDALDAREDGYFLLGLIGPLDPAWREELRSGGLQLVDTASPHGLLVRGDDITIQQLAHSMVTSEGEPVIRHALPLPEQTRTAPDVEAWIDGRAVPDEMGMRTEGGRALVRVELHSDVDPHELHPRVAAILQRGPEFIEGRRAAQFRATAPGIVRLLEEVPEVAFVHGEYPRETRNNLGAKDYITNIEPVWTEPTLGYTGAVLIAGVNDSGMDRTHYDFPSGTIVDTIGEMENAGGGGPFGSPGDAHGTHVTGTILGRGAAPSPTNTSGCGDQATPLPDARGMAWEAQVTHNNLFDGGITDIPEMMEWHAERGAVLNNNSWGAVDNYSYDSGAVEVDEMVRDSLPGDPGNYEQSLVWAAGNDGPEPETVGSPGTAKNALTVGASQSDRCGEYIGSNPDIDDLAAFSSRGPAQGRVKPDVVAPGTDVLSTESDFDGDCSGWDGEWTGDEYCTMPGTSMASPMVAGAATVFYEFFMDEFGSTPSPALVKAAFINTATEMGDGLPSMDYGWGRINLRRAIEGPPGGHIEFFDQDDVDHLSTGQDWDIDVGVGESEPFKVSVVWTDPPGSAGCSDCLVNDLDLIVTAPDGTVYRGNEFAGAWSEINPGDRDAVNNVENVYVENPDSGTWNVEVTSVNTATNPPGLSGQDFAVVLSGQLEEDEGFRLSADPEQVGICAGDDAQYDIGVRSLGGFDDEVTLSVTEGLPGGTSADFNPNPVTPADPAAISELTISDTGGVASDNYILEITGESSGPNFDPDSDTVNVTMTVTGKAPGSGDLLSPANGATGVSTEPEFSWQSFPDAVEYTIEVATDSSFNNIVISETVTETSFQPASPLDPGEEYFWRVEASNGCGDGPVSDTFSFTTVAEICSAPGSTISPGGSVSDTIDVGTSGAVEDLKVSVDLQFDWVGDLVVTLEHVDSATVIDLINRPGVDGDFGCDTADIDAVFDDDAAQLGNDMCNDTPPAIEGEVQPLDLLGDFEDEQLEGDWTLTITDEEGVEDAGTLNEWCLLPDTETTAFPVIDVAPEAFEIELPADDQTVEALEIFNLGDATLEWNINTAEATVLTDSEGLGSVGPGTGSDNPDAALALSDVSARPRATNVIAPSQAIDCDTAEGLIIHDDGDIDNGYSGNPEVVDEVTVVEGFAPAEPGTLGTVCVSFLSTGPDSVDFELVVFDDDGAGGAPGTELAAIGARAENLPQGVPAEPVWYTVDLSGENIQVESGTVYIGARWPVPGEEDGDPNVFIASDEEGAGPGVGYFRGDAGAWDELGADVFDDYQALFVRPQLTSGGCSDPTAIEWLSVDPAFGTTGPSSVSNVDVHFDSDGLAEGTYEALLCVNSNDSANSQVEVPVSLTVSAAEATQLVFDVQPSTTTVGEIIEPAITVEVQDAGGNVVTSDNDTVVVLTLTGGDPGATLSGTTSIVVSEGIATFADLSVDTSAFDYQLVASDSGAELDGDDSVLFDITQAASTTDIISISPAGEQTVNEPYTVTVNVDGFDPDGTVDVDDGAGASCQITLPDDSCELTSTSVGPKTITASYGGDANNAGSMDDTTYEIVEADSTTTITSIDPATEQTVGESYTVSVEVTGVSPTGTVDVDDGTGASCQITLPDDSCQLTSTSVGTKTITASYGGDDDNAPSSDQTGYEIVEATSDVEITEIDPAGEQTVEASYTVHVSVDGFDPSGTVDVDDGAGGTCQITLPDSSCQLTSTVVGPKTITADYSGDANNTADSDTTGYEIVAAEPHQLVFAVQPDDAISLMTMDTVVVHVHDEHGNLVDWDDDTEVGLSLLGGDPAAELTGGDAITVSGGVASFDALSIDLVGGDYQLEAEATGLTGALSVEFEVFHGEPFDLMFVDQPSTTQVNEVITPAVTVAVLDEAGNLADTDDETEVELTLTGGDAGATLSGTTSITVEEGLATFADLSVDIAGEGYQLEALDSESELDGTSSALFDITDISAEVTLTDLTQTYTGDPLGATVTTDPEGLSYEVTYDGNTTEPTEAGTYAVEATVTEPNYEGSASDTFEIEPAPATLELSDLEQTWDGDPKPVTVTTDPAGVSYSVTYDGSTEAPSEIGEYAVIATITDDNYTGDDATGTLVIAEATADVIVDDLNQTYTGDPLGATVTTDPEGLSYEVTYDGNTTEPTEAGTYAVEATVTEPNYEGSASDTFEIEPAPATLELSDLEQTWDGDPKPVTVTTDPAGVSYSVTYDGSTEAPSDVGEYAVVATITDDNYTGDDATGTLVIAEATADVIVDDLNQTYTGNPLGVTVTTDPEGLAVEVTYDGSTDEPTDAGSYAAVATVTEPNYEGSASDTFTIEPAPATLTLDDLEQAWDGDPKPVTVTPDPAGVSYSVTYDGSTEAPSDVGEYAVVATITDDNYTGDDATGTLIISEADSETSIDSISPADSQTVGESYVVTVSVTGDSPTGTVDVSDGDGASCQITLPEDSCSLTSTSVGARTITAEYSGDDSHGPSSDQTSYEITPAEPGLAIGSVDPADWQVAGLPYTVEIAIEGFEPSGTVTVDDGHGESCEMVLPETSCELTSSEVGETMLTAHYAGDDNNKSDQAQIAYEIEPSGPVELLFSTEPVDAVVDAPISPTVEVHVLDTTGELVEDDDETIVTIELETNPHGATLSGTLSVQVSGGIAVFDDLVIDTIGDGYRLRAVDDQNELDATVTEDFEVIEGGIFHDRFEDAAQ